MAEVIEDTARTKLPPSHYDPKCVSIASLLKIMNDLMVAFSYRIWQRSVPVKHSLRVRPTNRRSSPLACGKKRTSRTRSHIGRRRARISSLIESVRELVNSPRLPVTHSKTKWSNERSGFPSQVLDSTIRRRARPSSTSRQGREVESTPKQN